MAAEKTSALVIRLADFSESSRVVTLFSRDFGKLAVMAKGGRRLKGPFEAALDLLTECNVVFLRKSSSGLDILTEAQLVRRFAPPASHLPPLYAGYYIAELLDAMTEEYDPHPALYAGATRALAALAAGMPLHWAVLRFELLLLREIGQLPTFETCIACGAPIGDDPHAAFKPARGGLVCRTCQDVQAARFRTPLAEPRAGRGIATWKLLEILSHEAEPPWDELQATPDQLGEMRAVVNRSIAGILGRRPKTLRYLQF